MNEVAMQDSGNELILSTATQGAQELFVINLCASMTPMPAVPKNLKGFEKYKLYQVSRQEDGRRRFRLRLGFFTSEADAEWVLNSVRSLYPAAFTGCVSAEDMRYTGEVTPAARIASSIVSAAPPPAAPVAQPAPTQPAAQTHTSQSHRATPKAVPAKAAAVTPSVTPAAAATPAIAKPATTSPSIAPEPPRPAVSLSASIPAATPQPTKDAQSFGQPFHVGRGVDLPETDLELTNEYEIPAAVKAADKPRTPTAPPVKQPAASAPRATAPATPAAKAAATQAATNAPRQDGPIRSASIISPPRVVDDYVPILDTTLTIRTLTKTEADDPNRPKWFAVQLALSEQPINLDTMPKLDIFAAYTLYSVATMEDGSVKHALRLGFFRENVSAEAVMGYLKAFFNKPSINQISTAEFERFSEPKPRPKPIAEPEAKVVNLDAKRPIGPAKPLPPLASAKPATKPAGKAATSNNVRISAPARPQSFLSRLIGRQLD